MADLEGMQQYPEVHQLYRSLCTYMQSDAFQPSFQIALPQLMTALTSDVKEYKLRRLDNISQY